MRNRLSRHRFSPAFHYALSMVESISDTDSVVVLPVEPSLSMTRAGARAGHITPRHARTIYRAMAKAAQR